MSSIKYIQGDATRPIKTPAIIAHICNDIGGWGSGFVNALTDTYSQTPRKAYREWYNGDNTMSSRYIWYVDSLLYKRTLKRPQFKLGHVQFVNVNDEYTKYDRHDSIIYVANMIAQSGTSNQYNIPPIRYVDLEICLNSVAEQVFAYNKINVSKMTVHMPRIGCGLAGGDWAIIETIVERTLTNRGIDVYVYDLPDNYFSPGRVTIPHPLSMAYEKPELVYTD